MEVIHNATVKNDPEAQKFENHDYNFQENSGDILFDNSSNPDLHFLALTFGT